MTHEEAISILEESAINAGLCAEKEGLTPAESLLKWPEIRTALEEVRAERDRYRDLAIQAAPILRRLSLAQEGNTPACPGQALAIEIESALKG